MKQLTFYNKRSQVIIHVIVWMIVFLLPYLLYNSHNNPPRTTITADDEKNFSLLNFVNNFLWVGMFYFNAFVLIPKYLYPNKHWHNAIVLLVCFAAIMLLHTLLFKIIIAAQPFSLLNSIRFNLPTFLLAIAASTTWKLSEDRLRTEKLTLQKQEENLKTELSFLRSQISPHFVFNVLNNIVALVRLKSDDLEPTVMKLSSLMQYMLYETNEEKVLVKTEAEYLQAYIDLQQQRFGKKIKINTTINLYNDWNEIEPMLLIPFVENAFKHGVGMIKEPQINIDLHTTEDNTLLFKVSNKYSSNMQEVKDKTSGIGLANVKRRLNLLYGNNQSLDITKEDNWFSVVLKIKLH